MQNILKYAFCLFLLAAFAAPADAQKIRRLLLFANDSTDAALQIQREMLQADSAGIVKRDIWIAAFTSPKEFRRMFEHYNVGRTDFTLILIDKNGVEKLRSDQPVPLKSLFEIIDNPQSARKEEQGERKNH